MASGGHRVDREDQKRDGLTGRLVAVKNIKVPSEAERIYKNVLYFASDQGSYIFGNEFL